MQLQPQERAHQRAINTVLAEGTALSIVMAYRGNKAVFVDSARRLSEQLLNRVLSLNSRGLNQRLSELWHEFTRQIKVPGNPVDRTEASRLFQPNRGTDFERQEVCKFSRQR